MTFSTSGRLPFRQSTRTGLRLAAFALALSFSANGRSDDAPAPSPETPTLLAPPQDPLGETRLLILSAASGPEDEAALKRSISAQLADLRVDVFFVHLDDPSRATGDNEAAAVLEMQKLDAKTAFVIESAESQVLLRILQETENGIEVTERLVNAAEGAPQDEALAVIVRSAAAAIINRTEVPPTTPIKKPDVAPAKKNPPPPRPVETDKPPRLDRTHLGAEIGGSLGWFSKNVQPFAGITLSLLGLPHPNLFLQVGYTAFSTIESRAYSLLLTLKRHPVFIGMGYFRRFKHLFVSGGVSLILDYITENISSTNPAYTFETEGGELVTVLACQVLTGVRIRKPVSLFVRVSAEIPLQNVNYGVHTLKGDTVIIDPMPVQPVLGLGLAVDFF